MFLNIKNILSSRKSSWKVKRRNRSWNYPWKKLLKQNPNVRNPNPEELRIITHQNTIEPENEMNQTDDRITDTEWCDTRIRGIDFEALWLIIYENLSHVIPFPTLPIYTLLFCIYISNRWFERGRAYKELKSHFRIPLCFPIY